MPELRSAYPLRAIFATAWAIARGAARAFGGRARQYLAGALKQAWAQAKDTAAMRGRVLAAVAALRFEASALGVAIRRRGEAAFDARLRLHAVEAAARTAAYRARWGSGASVPATRVAA